MIIFAGGEGRHDFLRNNYFVRMFIFGGYEIIDTIFVWALVLLFVLGLGVLLVLLFFFHYYIYTVIYKYIDYFQNDYMSGGEIR